MPLSTGPVSRAQIPNLLEPGIRKLIFDRWKLYVDEYQWMYEMDGSEKAQEHEVVASGMSTFGVISEGDEVTFDSMQEAYKKTYTHDCFGKGIKVTRRARRDDLYGLVRRTANELGRTAKYTKNVRAMSVLTDMTTTTIYTLNGVNRPLVSLTHQRVDGGTWPNRFTNPAAPSVESVELALIMFEKEMVDHRGRPQGIMPKYIWCGPSHRFIMRRLLETQLRPFGNNNDINVLRDYNLELKVLHHINDDGRWGIMGMPGETGLRYFNRETFTIETDREPTTRNDIYMAFYEESHGATHPLGFWGNPP